MRKEAKNMIRKWLERKRRKAAKNIRVKNLVYDMMENRQSDRAIEIDLLHRKEKALG